VVGQLRVSKSPAAGTRLHFDGGATAVVTGRTGPGGDLFELVFDRPGAALAGAAWGHMPLPPYIRRADDASTVPATRPCSGARPGAVAAPTAGLHFDDALLAPWRRAGSRRRP
jgi:S-adenosylmethionine:tRNA ribosyltransferase-isomerase